MELMRELSLAPGVSGSEEEIANIITRELNDVADIMKQNINELLNREETYNGYFDRKPKVGYVDPLKIKKRIFGYFEKLRK